MEIYRFITLVVTFIINFTSGQRIFTKTELGDVSESFDGSGCPGDTRHFDKEKAKYFRYLQKSDKYSNVLYVGAMNNVYKINLSDMRCLNYNESKPSNDTIRRCYIQGKDRRVECQNHIRVVMEIHKTLLVCGTGGYAPIRYQLNNLSSKIDGTTTVVYDHLEINETMNGVAYCPFDPWDNYTAILITDGNPGNQTVPYFGTYTDFIKSSPVFYRPRFEGLTDRNIYSEKTTDREEIGWLNLSHVGTGRYRDLCSGTHGIQNFTKHIAPQFVGSFDDDDEVIFFFRETSIENTLNRNKIYSRVGKVCKQDLGGGSNEMATKTKWLSFQKARLICSIPGTSPHYFDDIYDVYQTGEYFYALFYKQKAYDEDNVASAVCVYRKSDIAKVFKGKFQYRTSSGEWAPVPDANNPDPRLDNCQAHINNRDIFNNKVSMFQLMADSVKPLYGKPILFKPGIQFVKIAVSDTKNGTGENGTNIYLATDEGEVHDMLFKTFEKGSPAFYIEQPATIYRPFNDFRDRDSAIWNMKLLKGSLVMGTDFKVINLNIENICSKIKDINICITNTLCKWAKSDGGYCTKSEDDNSHEFLDWKNVTKKGAIISIKEEILESNEYKLPAVGEPELKKGLYCTVPFKAKIFTDSKSIVWYKNQACTGRNVLHENPEKYAISLSNELVIKNISLEDATSYSVCYQGLESFKLKGYKLNVVEEDKDIIDVWKQQFNEWSSAFLEWKKCAEPYYDSCNAN